MLEYKKIRESLCDSRIIKPLQHSRVRIMNNDYAAPILVLDRLDFRGTHIQYLLR
jgi:hypothetical protein